MTSSGGSSGRRVTRRDRDRSLVRLHVTNPSDLAHTELTAGVGVPEVDVVDRAVRSLGEVDDVTVWSVCGTVGRLEVHRAGDVAAGVEGQALDPVLCVVGVEVAAPEAAGVLAAPVDESSR